jgi:hypothetical protein
MHSMTHEPFSRSADRRIFVVWMGAIWVAVLLGFVPDVPRYLGEAPPPPFILHFHSAIFLLWLVLVSLQILWVKAGNLRLHRNLGWVTVVISALMVPTTLVAAFVDQARQVTHPEYMPQFLAVEFGELLGFCGCMTAGILWRTNPAAHKRLMLLSVVSISDAATARIFLFTFPVHPPGVLGFFAQFFWGNILLLVAMMAWDRWRHGRVHPALVFGASLIFLEEVAATTLYFSPAWQQAMVRLVNAWGYTG